MRSHGLAWSIRNEVAGLKSACSDVATLAGKDRATQSRALAFLICSLGSEAVDHKAINTTVREWLRANHPLPAAPALDKVNAWLLANNPPHVPAATNQP